MKKVLSFVLAIMMLVGLMVPASAETPAVTVSLVPSATDVNVGDTITVDVVITENHYMVNGHIQVVYDPSALELQKVWDDVDNPYFEAPNAEIFTSKYMCAFQAPVAGQANFAFASSATRGTTVGGTMYTLTFKVLETANAVNTIRVVVPEMCGNNTQSADNILEDYDIVPTLVNATVNVAGVILKGDVDGNGEVALKDALMVFQHVNGKITLDDEQLAAADVATNGAVELADALRMFQYVNGKIISL